jgi:hypothetical protein
MRHGKGVFGGQGRYDRQAGAVFSGSCQALTAEKRAGKTVFFFFVWENVKSWRLLARY